MKQEKWDELHKELDDALESGFDTAKVALRKYLLDNKEKVAADLEEMRKKSNHTMDTIEEAAANLADPNICKTDNWIAGAKWQQERMYSEEEAYTIWQAGQEYWKTSGASITFEELTEQFKKK
ncbi:hypothetical protein UFOVP972_152 [uncultured Caudovirales phage]|uniref:Uncharacterized protein n=1 Tax=uncultured Caudovirales phage TaxID=2100421 RepID=A0A6J5Q1C1_9CAUD|nr:hypothetical protein UFOVP972_152 [uncultured Caudovirales phage]